MPTQRARPDRSLRQLRLGSSYDVTIKEGSNATESVQILRNDSYLHCELVKIVGTLVEPQSEKKKKSDRNYFKKK